MLERLAEPAGRDVLDIGCGGGWLVRELTARGANVVGLEISREQLATAIARDDGAGARYLVGRAQQLPIDDESVDLAIFMRTLHHVPPDELTGALREARRVLRPGGAIYVAEPLAQGEYFALTSMVEDELGVRQAAQEALANAAQAGLERVTTVDYDVRIRLRAARVTHVHEPHVTRRRVRGSHAHQLGARFTAIGAEDEKRLASAEAQVHLLRAR